MTTITRGSPADLLFNACLKGETEHLNSLLYSASFDVHTLTNVEGDDLLHYAIRSKQFTVAEHLITRGFPVALSLLSPAVATGERDMVNTILNNLTSPPLRILKECLDIACTSGYVDIVGILLPLVPDTNWTDGFYKACTNGHHEIAKLFIKSGYRFSSPSQDTTMFNNCMYYGYTDVVQILVQAGMRIDYTSSSVLFSTTKGGLLHLVQTALLQGGHSNITIGVALESAASAGHSHLIPDFMAASAGFRDFDEYKLKAVNSFLRKGQPEGAMMIIDSGLDVNKQLFGNATLLMAAAEGGCKDMVTMLLNKGLDPNAITVDKDTPLSYASDPDIVRMLLDAKANATIGPALYMSCVKHQPASVQMLLEARASVAAVGCRRSPLYTVIEHNAADDKIDDKIAIINLLLDAGARTVKMNRDDDSALHLVAKSHCPSTSHAIEVLVARKPLLGECRNDYNRTPLMSAVDHGTRQSIKALVGAGVNVDAKISNGMTVLHLALYPNDIWKRRRGFRQRIRDIVRILLEGGANPLECTHDGETAVMMLFKTGSQEEDRYTFVDNVTSVFIRDIATSILFPSHAGYRPLLADH